MTGLAKEQPWEPRSGPGAGIVYDACMDDEKAKEVFAYATEHGVEVVIPPNKLKERNAVLRIKRLAKRGGGSNGQNE